MVNRLGPIGGALLGLIAAVPAFGHAMLERASPSAGSQLATPPAAVTMTFSAPVEPRFSVIEVNDAQGKRLETQAVRRVDGKTIAVDLPSLRPGDYTVIWRATSVDTHKTQGRFEFTVRP